MIFLTLTQRLKVEDWCLEEGHSTPVLERTKPFYPSCIIPSWAQLRGRVHPPDCRLSLWPLALAGAPACGIWVGEHWFQLKKISEILATTWQLSNQLGLSGLQPAAACSQLLTGIDGADGVNHHPRDFFYFLCFALLGFNPMAHSVQMASDPEIPLPGGISKWFAKDKITST